MYLWLLRPLSHTTDIPQTLLSTGYCRSVYLWLLRPLSHTTDIPQTLLLATTGQFIYGCYVHSAILQTFHRRCYWLLQVSVSMAATSTQPYYRHSTDAATGYCRSVYLRLLRPLSHTTDIPQTLLLATTGQCIYGCYVHSAILQTFHRRCYWLLQVSVSTAATSTQPYYRHSTDAATGYCRSVYLWLLRPLSHTTDIPQALLLATAGQCIYGCYVHSAILQTFHRRCYWLLQVSVSTAATSTQPYYRHSTDAATGYCRYIGVVMDPIYLLCIIGGILVGQNLKSLGNFMNCRENWYIFLPPPHPYPTGGGGGFRGQNVKVAKHKVLKSISEFNYPERLHCKYPQWSQVIRGGREGAREGRKKGGRDVMAIMKWVHMAWNGCIIGKPSKAG